MDKKSYITFIIISAAIILGWELVSRTFDLGAPGPPEEAPEPVEELEEALPPDIETPERILPDVADEIDIDEEHEPAVTDYELVDEIELSNDKIRMKWTSRGAGLQSLKLTEYKAPFFTDKKEDSSHAGRPVLTLLSEFHENSYSDVIERIIFRPGDRLYGSDPVDIDQQIYEVVSHSPSEIVFRTNVREKLEIFKRVYLAPGEYHYHAEIRFENRTDEDVEFEYHLRTAAGIEREVLRTRYLSAAVAARPDHRMDVHLTGANNIEGVERIERENIVWAGVLSQYFIAMLWPDSPDWIRAVESKQLIEKDLERHTGPMEGRSVQAGDYPNATSVIQSSPVIIPPGDSRDFSYRFITVPMLSDILDAYDPKLTSDLRAGRMTAFTNILSLGTISFLAPLMVWILDLFHSIIPNYGIAIIMLTFLIRGTLHPLTRKSQISMHKMKKLQPHLQELMKKHGDDRQKMAQEQWKLYSKYGVHPMKGCFPMLLQMPVFLALFEMLRTTVQLRQAVFIPGWVTDLSQPDTVWEMPISLPILGNNLNILPVIMAGAWMLNQQLTPAPSDPKMQQQQKIMKWLPLIFAFMFYNFASGLLLYITFSSIIGALEHWHIRKKAEGIELVPVDEQRKEKLERLKRRNDSKQNGNNKQEGKKGWFQRLIDAEELKQKQSRQLRNKDKNNKS